MTIKQGVYIVALVMVAGMVFEIIPYKIGFPVGIAAIIGANILPDQQAGGA